MSGFEFRLDNILELRAETESLAASELTAARTDLAAAEAARRALQEARASTRERLSSLQTAGTDAGQLQAMAVMLDRVEQSIAHATETVERERERVAECRTAYERANRERRALEELKARRREAWNRDSRRRDQLVLDEFATTRHARNGSAIPPGGES